MWRVISVFAFFMAVQPVSQANGLGFVPVPALDDMGLIALSSIVGLAGAFAARRRKKK